MKTSETLGQFAEAMAKVQAELRPAQMNAKNPFLKNKYADLADVVEACQKLSASHGLATVQMPFSCNDGVGITTRIIHTSGEWVEGEVIFPLFEEKGISMAQAAGKLITYARRYALASAFGVVADEDADGNDTRVEQKAAPQKKATGAATSQYAYSDGEIVAEAGRDIFDKFKTAHNRIPASRDEMAAWYKAQKDGQAPTPPPAPEQGTAGDVDGVAPLLDGVHYQALLAKTDPSVGDVIAALNGDNVTTPPIARGIIEQLYATIKPTPATKLKPETAATMYEAVVNHLGETVA